MAPVLTFPFKLPVRVSAPRRFLAFALAGFFMFAAWYLLAANAVVSASYRLSDAETARVLLLRDIDGLRATIAAQGTPEAVEKRAEELGFVPVSRATYLPVPGTTVAVR